MLNHITLFLLSFGAIWFGSGLIVSSIDRFSRRLKLSSFAVSFFILGILTSIPEFAVGLTAVAENDPDIFAGNLLGGIPVIFLFVIPVFAILGKGIRVNHGLEHRTLLFNLFVIVTPAFFIVDGRVSSFEGSVLIMIYVTLFYLVQRKRGLFSESNESLLLSRSYSLKDIFKILFGVGLVFISSQIIVDKTVLFAHTFNVSEFFIGFILLSFGTNLPELSVAVRSAIARKKDVAFGDYMGSASANVLFFGIFSILAQNKTLTHNNYFATFLFIVVGIVLFYLLTRRDQYISFGNAIVLLAAFILMGTAEFFLR